MAILLEPGEAQAIALAMDIPDSTVLRDDTQARRATERFGIKRIGTPGILRRTKKANLIDAVKPYTVQLQNLGFRHNGNAPTTKRTQFPQMIPTEAR